MVSLDTHSYDGKLKDYKIKFQEDLKTVAWLAENVLSFEEAIKEAKDLAEKRLDRHQIMLTLRLFETKQGNNDTANNLTVEEVFPMIWAAIRSLPSRMSEHDAQVTQDGFFEQLADVIQRGPCAQGRVTRLLNYYSLIRD